MRSALLATLLCTGFVCNICADTLPDNKDTAQLASHYFWNEVTGETQYEDPGDVPLHDPEGNCFWLDDQGNRVDQDPHAGKYAWVETWSEEHNRPFFYDQVNQVSTWDKPADLAWRRVYVPPETAGESPCNFEPNTKDQTS